MLRTPTPDAEEIKSARSPIAKQVLASPEESVEVPGLGDRGPRQVKRRALGAVIEPRVEELFGLVQQVIRESGYEGFAFFRGRIDRGDIPIAGDG